MISLKISAVVSILAVTQLGCATVRYIAQAAKGQFEISNRTKPIADVIKSPQTSESLKRLLQEVPAIKAFGESKGLKATKNYESYVDLKRPYVVWVVSASEKLAFKARSWSFPIVGSFTYMGWFSEEAAAKQARSLTEEGFDADVRGASAYSTLGWFNDPIINTMILPGDKAEGGLVNLLLHESVHATFYRDGQSTFNEGLAVFVADRLAPEYLAEKFGKNSKELAAYREHEERGDAYGSKMKAAYESLDALYASSVPDAEKLEKKAGIYEKLTKDLSARRTLNNASLIQYKTYGTGLKEFQSLFERCGEDWGRFWSAVRTIDKKSFESEQMDAIGSVIDRVRC